MQAGSSEEPSSQDFESDSIDNPTAKPPQARTREDDFDFDENETYQIASNDEG